MLDGFLLIRVPLWQVLRRYNVQFENLHYQLPRYEINASKQIFLKSYPWILQWYQIHQEYLPNEYHQNYDDEYGHHLLANSVYIYRSTGGSWSGSVGAIEEFWDGIFLSAGIRDATYMNTHGSLYWTPYHPINRSEGLGKGTCILIIQGTASNNQVDTETGIFNNDVMHTEQTASGWTTLGSLLWLSSEWCWYKSLWTSTRRFSSLK